MQPLTNSYYEEVTLKNLLAFVNNAASKFDNDAKLGSVGNNTAEIHNSQLKSNYVISKVNYRDIRRLAYIIYSSEG